MPLAEIRERYDDEMRRRLAPPPGRARVEEGPLTMIVGPSRHALDHMVFHSRLATADADDVIRRALEAARRERRGIQWNVYDGDEPDDLVERLSRAGFAVQGREDVMVSPSGEPRLADGRNAAEVRRIESEEGLRDFFAVQEAVWSDGFSEWVRSWLVPALRGEADPVGVFVSYEDGAPVGSAWVALTRGRSFANLFGGTVRAESRGRGVYRGLLAARARLAHDAGFPWIVADANDRSGPILARWGFRPIARRTEMVIPGPPTG